MAGSAQSRPRRSSDYYEAQPHCEALARLEYLYTTGKRFAMLCGEAGSGKSTSLRAFAAQCRQANRPAFLIDAAGLSGDSLLVRLGESLGCPSRTCRSAWDTVTDAISGLRLAGRRTALLFDHIELNEAGVAATIRRLLALEDCTLALADAMRGDNSGWLVRSDLRIDVHPFSEQDTAGFLRWLANAHGKLDSVFDEAAVDAIHRTSDGLPRDVHRLAEFALLSTRGNQTKVLPDLVAAAIGELQSLRHAA